MIVVVVLVVVVGDGDGGGCIIVVIVIAGYSILGLSLWVLKKTDKEEELKGT